MSVQWRINPIQIIQIILILGLAIFGWAQYSAYMDAKYKTAELREQKEKAEENIRVNEILLKKQEKKILLLRQKIKKWEKKDSEIKMSTDFNSAIRDFGLE